MRFEKVSDTNDDYCHLELFIRDEPNPRLEVSLDERGSIHVTIYPSDEKLVLSKTEWEWILREAESFAVQEVANEAAFQRMLMNEHNIPGTQQ